MNPETRYENTGHTVEELLEIVKKIGGVLMVFIPNFVFGGKRIECRDKTTLRERADEAWQISPTSEVICRKIDLRTCSMGSCYFRDSIMASATFFGTTA
jgi:hypothetical protein